MLMDILDYDILTMNFDQPEPHVGNLLLAEPLMTDNDFRHSVILLVEHSNELGSMGFITNRRANFDLNELVDEITISEEIPIYIGGPVHRDRLYFIHTLGELIPESVNLGTGLYVSGNFDVIIEYINSGAQINGKIRFFLGYSGWEKEQLKDEIQNYDWAVTKLHDAARLLTLDEEDAWRDEVSRLDEKYILWRNCPSSIILN